MIADASDLPMASGLSLVPTPPRPLRLLCVDDDLGNARAIIHMTCGGENPEFQCVGLMGSVASLVLTVARLQTEGRCPELVTMNVSMSGLSPITTVMAPLLEKCRDIRVVMYSAQDDRAIVEDATTAGAWGYVIQGTDPWEIARALRIVAGGEKYVSATTTP